MFNRMNNNVIRHQNVVKYRDVLPLICSDCHFTPKTGDFTHNIYAKFTWLYIPRTSSKPEKAAAPVSIVMSSADFI